MVSRMEAQEKSGKELVLGKIRATVGLIASMLCGAVLGAFLPFKAEGLVASVVVCSVLGALIWERRTKSSAATISACIGVVVIGWPVAVALLDWLHRYY